VSRLTNHSALIAVNGSGSRHVLFDDVEADHRRERIGTIRQISHPEQHLPRQQVRKQRRGRREQRVPRQKLLHARPEGSARESVIAVHRRRRKRQEIVQIRRHAPLHPLQRPPVLHHSCNTKRVIGFRGACDRSGRKKVCNLAGRGLEGSRSRSENGQSNG
jgi:hypothetical protein